MTDSHKNALDFIEKLRDHFLDELKTFISIPSISTSDKHYDEIYHAAVWLEKYLLNLGLESTNIFPTGGLPIVYGESITAGTDAPTVLIYGHYDVQPIEPLNEWISPPFEPAIRGDYLYGRGATDMMGQIMAALNAYEVIRKAKDIPINVKFLFEGEEEIGSPNLEPFISKNKQILESDFALNLDTGMIDSELPTITYALRGLAYFEVRIHGPKQDLHSGVFGGVLHNPAQVLCELIAGMHDEQGRVTLPGFYDQVVNISDDERSELAQLPMNEDFYLQQTGAPNLWGEDGYTPVERTGARPTLDVNGFLSGFTDKGAKTVLPASAMAKLSSRLVPNQDPEEVHNQLIKYLHTNAPPTVKWELEKIAAGHPSLSDRNTPWVKAYKHAAKTVWDVEPVYKREGGSVPVIGILKDTLGIESLNIGFSLPSDNMHSPNERIHLPTWFRGIEALVHYFFNLNM